MEKQRILLIGGNYHPEPTGIGKYNGEMIDWLSAQGHECGVVATYPYYPHWKVQEPYAGRSFWYRREEAVTAGGGTVNVFRCPHYVPAVPTGARRMLSDLSFMLSAFFQVLVLLFKRRYDFVITVAPPFQLGVLGFLYKKLRGGKLVYHVQDLQIDAACELGMIRSKALLKAMFAVERFILKNADGVSTISEGMTRKMRAKHHREFLFFPNWTDTESVCPLAQAAELKKEFGFNEDDKIVLYSGAIGEKQGLQTLLACAQRTLHQTELKYLVCGSGPYKQTLMQEAKRRGLSNLVFMPLQPQGTFNRFLNLADVHLVLQKANANDLVMPSKLTAILSVGGLAVVAAEPHTSLYSVVSCHNVGLLTAPEDDGALHRAIQAALNEPAHQLLRQNARAYAVQNLRKDTVLKKYWSEIFALQDRLVAMRKMDGSVLAEAVN